MLGYIMPSYVKPYEKLLIAVITGGVVMLLGAAAIMAVGAVAERLSGAAPPGGAYLWLRRAVWALAGIACLCLAYARLAGPYRLEVTHVRLESPKLRGARREVRLVQISDVQSDPRPRLEDRLPDVIAPLSPDAVVFTGDAINALGGLPHFQRCLARLADLAPTFAVRGNWGLEVFPDVDLFGGTGAVELDGEASAVEVEGATVWIAGAAVADEPRIAQALDRVPPGAFTVLLYHYPDELPPADQRRVDLHCAGHTHGGQVALPLFGAIVTFAKHGRRYQAGLYRAGRTFLYVNRGIGMEGGPTPRIRFCSRPEVTVFHLGPGSHSRAASSRP